MSLHNRSVGAFVRAFFNAAEKRDFQVVLLHGWENGCENPLGDVDLVVAREALSGVSEVLAKHARRCGWRLCQVLCHESTAVFCVCSSVADPSVVVALDICSDYRSRERVLMTAEDLLRGCERLDWGGYRVSRSNELRYRFLKAAVKRKDPSDAGPPLLAFQESDRIEFIRWLEQSWGVALLDWSNSSLQNAWIRLSEVIQRRPRSGWVGALRRVAKRLMQPTGLVVEVANDAQKAEVVRVFRRLYFRRCLSEPRFRFGFIKVLPSSTLVVCDQVPAACRCLLGSDLLLSAEPDESLEALSGRIAAHLAERCARREGYGSSTSQP